MKTLTTIALLLAATLAAQAAITFDSSFECGNGTAFSLVASNEYNFELELDTNSDDEQWFYFSVAGAQGETLTFHLLDTNDTNVPSHWGRALPIASSDGGATWDLINGSTSNDTVTDIFTFSHTLGGDPERIAFHFPYTHTHHLTQMDIWDDHTDVARSVIGSSTQGRDIELLRITNTGFTPTGGKMGFWIVARQHAAEVTGSWSVDGLIEFLLSSDPDAAILRNYAVINIVPMMNPDGVIAGNYRDNFVGENLNREWDTPDLVNSPEVLAVTDEIAAWVASGESYDFFCDMHSTSGGTANFAFHADPLVEPPLYHTPSQYAEDLDDILALMAGFAPDFNDDTGNSISTSQALSRQRQMFQYGVLAILTEGTYSYPNYGPNSGQYMTPARHQLIGEALGRALRSYFLSGVPIELSVLTAD